MESWNYKGFTFDESDNLEVLNTTHNSSSLASAKPVRTSNMSGTSIRYCQVHGCKKDLSSSKDYHKRHRVCEVHSKTAIVIVNGIEQRFCQQCSRFHSLPEFDDGKRSCRKRLAGHNERRRKPQVSIHYPRTGRLFQPYKGTRFHRNTVATSSFICPDILPSNPVHLNKPELNGWCVKVEDMPNYNSQSKITVATQQVHSRSLVPSYANNNQYKPDPSTSYYGPHFPFQNNLSLGADGLTFVDSGLTAQALSGVTDSGPALSLLSSPSHSSSSHSTLPDCRLFGVGPWVNVGPAPVSDSYGFKPILQDPGFSKAKGPISCEGGPTVDLLQLSSQFQEVEHQRQPKSVGISLTRMFY